MFENLKKKKKTGELKALYSYLVVWCSVAKGNKNVLETCDGYP